MIRVTLGSLSRCINLHLSDLSDNSITGATNSRHIMSSHLPLLLPEPDDVDLLASMHMGYLAQHSTDI